MAVTVNDIIKELSLEVINLFDGNKTVEGGYTGDLLSWVMSRAENKNAWITIMNNSNIIAVAALLDLSCIILSENVAVDYNLKKLANEKNINLLRSEKDSFTLCYKLGKLI